MLASCRLRSEWQVDVAVNGYALARIGDRGMHDGRHIDAFMADMRAVVMAIMMVNMMFLVLEVGAMAIMNTVAVVAIVATVIIVFVMVLLLMLVLFVMMLVAMAVIVSQCGQWQRQ
jgi:hypothetical protein